VRATVVGRLCAATLAATLALTVVGCGGGSTATGGSAAGADPALSLSRCMRAHGVSNFPDPAAGGPLVLPDSINPDAPAFQSAQRACSKLLPGGGPGGASSASVRLAMLKVARCLRAHGLPDFPDPTSTPPSPAGQPGGLALGRGGWFLVVSDPQAPAFRRAAAVCHFPLPRPRAG